MLQKLCAVAAWACLIFIIYATLSSIDARPRLTDIWFYKTVVERFAAYAFLGLLFYLVILAVSRSFALSCLAAR